MSNYITTLKVDDSDYLAKIQRATAELNKNTQAARQANEQTRQEATNRQALVRVTEAQRRETDKLKEAQERQGKSLSQGKSPFREILEEIPMMAKALNFLDGPLGKLAMRYKDAAGSAALLAGATLLMARQIGRAQTRRDQSLITGVGTERLQAITGAAQGLNADPAQVFTSISEVRKNQGAALSGQQEQVKAFQQLGVSMADLQSQSPDELFLKIAQRLGQASAGAQDFTAATKLMGEGSKTLFPAFERDLAGLVKGWVTVRDSTTQSLATIGDHWTLEWQKMKATASGVMAETAGMVSTGVRTIMAFLTPGIGQESLLENLANDIVGVGQASKDAARQAEKLADALKRASDQELDKAKELMALDEQIADLEFESLDALQQKLVLQEKLSGVRAQMREMEAKADPGPNAEERWKLLRREELALALDLKRLENPTTQEGSTPQKLSGTSADSLQRVGIFRGAASMTALERLAHEQITLMRQMVEAENNTTSAVREAND